MVFEKLVDPKTVTGIVGDVVCCRRRLAEVEELLVYLDNCCYNRPFGLQSDLRICLETMAKLRVQALMKNGAVEYVWSDALDYELGQSPNYQDPDMILPWRQQAVQHVPMEDALIERAGEIQQYGLKAMDSLHIASAERADSDWFLTTDKGILKKLKTLGKMRIANPIDFIASAMKGVDKLR